MTNLMHTCFILQYVHYNPLLVSSITCSSSGGKFHLCNIWYRPLSQWPSGAQVEVELHSSSTVHIYSQAIHRTTQLHFCKSNNILIHYMRKNFIKPTNLIPYTYKKLGRMITKLPTSRTQILRTTNYLIN